MLLIAFVAFLLLVVAWLAAPNGSVKAASVAPGPSPTLPEPATA